MKPAKKIRGVGVFHDTSKPCLGGHLTHLAFKGLPRTEIAAFPPEDEACFEDVPMPDEAETGIHWRF